MFIRLDYALSAKEQTVGVILITFISGIDYFKVSVIK